MKQHRILREFNPNFMSEEVMKSQDVAQRADFALTELSNGGLLNPTQQNEFFELINNYPALINKVRKITMPAPQYEISKLGFGSRAFHVAQSATALTQAQRSKPSTEKLMLTSKKIMASFYMPYEVFEDNIARGTLQPQLLRLFADRLALDTEELGLLGDPALAGTDDDLAAFTGYIKRITSHTVNAAATGMTPDSFNSAILALPEKYRRNMSAYKFFCTPNAVQTWKNELTNRQTGLGDKAITGIADDPWIHGIQMTGVPLMPTGTCLLVQPQNLIMGVQRELTLEADKDIETQEIKFVYSARLDFQIEHEPMCVKMTGLGV